jgi:hypothetical protein
MAHSFEILQKSKIGRTEVRSPLQLEGKIEGLHMFSPMVVHECNDVE